MRIRRIDLIRYGCFTEARLDLPKSGPDMHVMVGPNESGKSTVLLALADLLFGIGARTPMNFQHRYRDMRLGAEIESNGAVLQFRRRKGRKNTVLTTDDLPMPGGEGALDSFLGSADRKFFERVFSLDHSRLRTGGQEILEAKGDLGEALFSAGSGVQALSQVRRKLATRADRIWSKRRSAKREYYKAWDRLAEAKSAYRKNAVSALDWQKRRKEYERCREVAHKVQGELESVEANLRKNNRIRRVARPIRDKARFEAEIKGLARVTDFPEDARDSLNRAEQDYRIASQRAADQGLELKRVTRERAALQWDESLMLRNGEIVRLDGLRSVALKGKGDLPKREAELASEEGRLLELGAELGWKGQAASDLAERIPSRATVADARKILRELGKARDRAEDMQRALRDAESAINDADRDLRAIRVPPDVSKLSPLVSATQEQFGDLGSRIHSAESAIAEAGTQADTLARRLRPAVESTAAASELTVPTRREVNSFRDSRLALDRDIGECRKRIRDAENKIAVREANRDRIERNERPVSREQVLELRDRRDVGWNLVRRIHIEGESVPEAEVLDFAGDQGVLATAYESAVESADRAVDRSVETASAAARLEEAGRALEAARLERSALGQELRELEVRSAEIEVEWKSSWESVPFEPLKPDAMLSWLETHAELRQALAVQANGYVQLEALRQREAGVVATFAEDLRGLGVEPETVQDRGLRYMLDFVAELQRNHAIAADKRARIEQQRDQAAARKVSKRGELDTARSAEGNWRSKWTSVLIELGLHAGLTTASTEAQFDIVDQMRGVRSKIDNLRHKRIEMIRKDIEEFEADVSRTASAIDPSLLERSPGEAVLELVRRLGAAKRASQNASEKDQRIQQIEKAIRRHKDEARHAKERIMALQALAGTESVDDLRAEIGKAERRRELQAKIDKAIRVLEQDGDGRSVEELEAECQGIDLDRAKSQEAGLEQEIRQLRQQRDEALEQLREAEAKFNEVGGGDAGAVAEAARQNALAELREISERYVRTRTTQFLVRWAIDRHRREKQGPMLKRAGVLFSELTLGSFEGLELDYDHQDRPRLVGRRPDGERVDVKGMSDGTVDQLYLALRVSALEDYLRRGRSLPFIADDLFINFDERRSEAGLRILGRLARQCQVIFFTHHDHLVRIAGRALGRNVRVWRTEAMG